MKLRWRFGIIAGIFLAIFSLYPQVKLMYVRRGDWNGNYAYNDIDEVAYASYLQALIDGRPRKNDPYTGRDDAPNDPQPESLFSIQFAGPYTIAIPARLLGVNAPWAMTISGAAAAFLTALAVFWVIGWAAKDSVFAMAGSLVVLAGGALFAGEGAIGEIIGSGIAYPYFPGFRRYIPAMAFPAFFFFVGLVSKLVLSDEDERSSAALRPAMALTAIVCFGYCVFTYFYVWTTAAAWLGCLFIFTCILRPANIKRDIGWLLTLAAGCFAMLVPYAILLSHRSQTMDDVQLLVRTRAPDLMRTPELVSYVVFFVLAAAIAIGLLNLRDKGVIFAASLALTPLVLFNQQLLTGQSLQPIHYQVFIGNYVAALSAIVTLGIIWRSDELGKRSWNPVPVVAMALAAIVWGFVECHYTVAILDDVNAIRDEAVPVALRLSDLAKGDPNARSETVIHFGGAEADDLPTWAPQPVLWARHQHVFAGETWQENKERYYEQLYFEGVSPRQLADGMKSSEDFVSMIALFGWGRHTDRLSSEYRPLTFGEIDEEAANFQRYTETFDPSNAGIEKLSYLIVSNKYEPYLDRIDRWYQRDAGDLRGAYRLYKLTLR